MDLRRRVAAECFGTFCLVFGGVGSAVFAGGKIGDVGVALAFGLALLAMVYLAEKALPSEQADREAERRSA